MATKRAAIEAAPSPVNLKGWLVIAGGIATAAIVLAAWLPVGALLHQRAALSSANSQLSVLSNEGQQLTARSIALRQPGALVELARAYQLVEPGQVLIQVLTPSFAPRVGSADAPYPGDPGRSPLINPSEAGAMPTSPVASTSVTRSADRAGATPGFFARVVASLEFWR